MADWNGVDRFDSEECRVRRSAIVLPLPWTTGLLAYWTYGTPPLINRLYPFRPDPCWANAEPQLSEPKALPVELTSTQSVCQPTPKFPSSSGWWWCVSRAVVKRAGRRPPGRRHPGSRALVGAANLTTRSADLAEFGGFWHLARTPRSCPPIIRSRSVNPGTPSQFRPSGDPTQSSHAGRTRRRPRCAVILTTVSSRRLPFPSLPFPWTLQARVLHRPRAWPASSPLKRIQR